ncbi:MAG: hypothetical protein SFU98_20280 [Leptospiraceae bacterium]|nr:hypothetical protein [Leptospiraceae bacterium]
MKFFIIHLLMISGFFSNLSAKEKFELKDELYPVKRNTMTLSATFGFRNSRFSYDNGIWNTLNPPPYQLLSGVVMSWFPIDGLELGLKYMRPMDHEISGNVNFVLLERYKYERRFGDSMQIFQRIYLLVEDNSYLSFHFGLEKKGSIEYNYHREIPDGIFFSKMNFSRARIGDTIFNQEVLPDSVSIKQQPLTYLTPGFGFMKILGRLRMNIDFGLFLRNSSKDMKVIMNGDYSNYPVSPPSDPIELLLRNTFFTTMAQVVNSDRSEPYYFNVSFGVGF